MATAAIPYVGLALAAAYALGVFGGSNDNAQPAGPPNQFYTNLSVANGQLGSSAANYWTAAGQRKDGGQYSTGAGTYGNWTPDQVAAINIALNSMFDSFSSAAKTLGVSADVLNGKFTSDLSVAHTGATTTAALQAAMASLSDQVASALIPDIKNFQAANETLTQTFTRLLADVQGVQAVLDKINNGSKATVDLSEQLAAVFGGVSNLTSAFSAYYSAFYTQAEQDALATKQVTDAFAALGVAVPANREQFKALVDGLDLTTASGQTTLKALLDVAPAFDAVMKAATTAGTAILSLADQIAAVQTSASTAIDALIQSSQTAANAATTAAASYRTLATSLTDEITKIKGTSLAVTSDTLQTTFGAALSGNTTALAGLPKAADDYLAASLATSQTAADFARDQAKVVTMLQQANTASLAFAGIEDYRSTLLQGQINLLTAIKDELAKPDPNTAFIAQQTGLLGSVQGLLDAQSKQLITVASTLVDSNGHLIVGNALVDAETGLLVAVGQGQIAQLVSSNVLINAQTGSVVGVSGAVNAQTGQILVGLSKQDAIANLIATNNGLTTGVAAALVSIAGSSGGLITQGNTVIGLLQNLVTLTAQKVSQDAIDAANAAAASAAAAAAALAAAAAAAVVAAPAAAIKAIATATGASDLATARQAIIDWQNSSVSGFAGGGIASGWSMVGERGPELVNFSSPGRVYTAGETQAMMSGAANDDLLQEIRELNARIDRLQQSSNATAVTTKRHYDLVRNMTPDGYRMQTVATA